MGVGGVGAVVGVYGVCGGLVFYREGERVGAAQVRPLYTLLGGVIGAFITITVIQSMGVSDRPRL